MPVYFPWEPYKQMDEHNEIKDILSLPLKQYKDKIIKMRLKKLPYLAGGK